MKPVIDAEFASLIPPLTEEEYKQLEENLLSEGCRDALVVWKDILIDGHNRLKICEQHQIAYQVVERDFEDRDDAMRYIIQNQFGRRNLTLGNRSMLALRLEPLLAKKAKENQRMSQGRGQKGLVTGPNLFSPVNTLGELSKLTGVSPRSISRMRSIVNSGTREQIERVKNGGKGNTVTEVYREVRAAQCPPPDGQTPKIEEPLPTPENKSAELAKPCQSPEEELEEIRKYVSDLKNPDTDRSLFTTEMFLTQFAGFMEPAIRSLEKFTAEPNRSMYPLLNAKERKVVLAFNDAIIEIIKKIILLCEDRAT